MVYIVILAILTGMFIGFRRGFLRSVFKLLITILSVVLSYVLAPLIANWVISYTTLDDKLQASIASQMEETARQQVKNQLEASVGQYGITVTDDMVNAALDTQLSENQQADMLYQISMPEDARETILQNASANVADYAARSFYQYVAGCLAKMIVRAGIYVLTFLVISLLLFLLYMLLSLALRMASLGGLNRVMGAVFGGAQVLVYIWMVFIILHYVVGTSAGNVLMQWISLLGNLVMMTTIANLLEGLYQGNANRQALVGVVSILAAVLAVRYLCAIVSSKMSYLSSKAVKRTLREQIYQKMLRLGAGYHQRVQTSEVVQVAVEGVEQLETYFGAYLPQFFYAMLAPLTLFVYLSFVNLPSAAALLICVPLIPVAIAAVQTWAKKLLARYWGQYTEMGDTFLENLQGLTTLKIYQADGFKQEEMNWQAEQFRKITMKVLTMQLNSITIMDLIAYGGAALGVVLSVTQLRAGKVDLSGCLLIIRLSADFLFQCASWGPFSTLL